MDYIRMVLIVSYIVFALIMSFIWQTTALMRWGQDLGLKEVTFIFWWVLSTLPVVYIALRRWLAKDISGFWYPLFAWLVWSLFLMGTTASLLSAIRTTGIPILSEHADIVVALYAASLLGLWSIVGYHSAMRVKVCRLWVFVGIPAYLFYMVWYAYAPALGLLKGLWLMSMLYFIPTLVFIWCTWLTIRNQPVDIVKPTSQEQLVKSSDVDIVK